MLTNRRLLVDHLNREFLVVERNISDLSPREAQAGGDLYTQVRLSAAGTSNPTWIILLLGHFTPRLPKLEPLVLVRIPGAKLHSLLCTRIHPQQHSLLRYAYAHPQ